MIGENIAVEGNNQPDKEFDTSSPATDIAESVKSSCSVQ